MKVAMFGGTGFVGSYIVDKLISEAFIPKLLIRKGSESKAQTRCELISGNIQDKSAVRKTIEGTDAVIYNIGIIRQFPQQNITFNELHVNGVKSYKNSGDHGYWVVKICEQITGDIKIEK